MTSSIYDSDITTKCFAMMQKTFSSKEVEQFKALGQELEGIIKSYDPNNKENKDIFMQVQSISTFVMTYAQQTATFLGGERYKGIFLQKIDPIKFLTEHTPARIAYNMTEECGESGLQEVKFLTDTLNTVKNMYGK
jgi:hypothetical protein